jgi:hypothetical protein
MADGERYRKEQDLLFQHIDEKERVQKQVTTDEVVRYMLKIYERKTTQSLFEVLSPNQRREFMRAALRKKFPDLDDAN